MSSELVIHHIAGPLAPDVQNFSGKRTITVGRNPDSDVAFPAGQTSVGSDHLEIQLDAGRYELRVNTRNPVFVDGIQATDGYELQDGSEVRLGTRDGPGFRVEYHRDESLPKTDYYKPVDDDAVLLQKTRWKTGVLALSLLLALALGGLVYQKSMQSQEAMEALVTAKIGQLDKKFESQTDAADFSDVLAITRPSVYLVILKRPDVGETPLGTAWVVNKNQLATNAHVAEILDEIRENEEAKDIKLIVRSPSEEFQDANIESVRLHPGYRLMEELWTELRPVEVEVGGQQTPIEMIPAYDVALMTVTAGTSLAPPLTLVSENELDKLQTGQQIAYVGYPMEQLVQLSTILPNPVSHIARIIALTNFTRTKANMRDSQLIVHSLPATGGASGSPIINDQGKVIGLLNAGNVTFTSDSMGDMIRVPSAASVNFAQRVDLLHELLSGKEIDVAALRETLVADISRMNLFSVDKVLKGFISQWETEIGQGATSELLQEAQITIDGSVREEDVALYREVIDLVPGAYLVYGASEQNRDVDIIVLSRPGIFSEPEFIGDDRFPDSVPLVYFELPKEMSIEVNVVDAFYFQEEPNPRSTVKLGVRRLPLSR